MDEKIFLKIDGEVENPLELTFADLAALDSQHQVTDVSRIDPSRRGDAIKLQGILEIAGVKSSAGYLGLHASADDFHASIPFDVVRDRSLIIYRQDGKPLTATVGGPFRFFIRDSAACHTDEIDECASVKFVDHIELTREKGFDNRPLDEEKHQQLHQQQENSADKS